MSMNSANTHIEKVIHLIRDLNQIRTENAIYVKLCYSYCIFQYLPYPARAR